MEPYAKGRQVVVLESRPCGLGFAMVMVVVRSLVLGQQPCCLFLAISQQESSTGAACQSIFYFMSFSQSMHILISSFDHWLPSPSLSAPQHPHL
jgi:hypothetical protein